MQRSESVTKIAGALLKAQKLMGGASKGAANPYFKSKYADYGSVLEACKDLLNENGVVILQPHVSDNGKNFVETLLLHESGESISSRTEVICAKQNDPQALGSAITYARRYGLQSLLAMPAEDDDGEGAMNRAPKTPPTAKETSFQAAKAAAPKAVAPTPVAEAKPAEAAPAKKSSFKSAPKPAVEAPAPAAQTPADELGW
jgi:hypothetical protein